MNGDIYIRDGRRFKLVPNYVGLYYNGVCFTNILMPDSIAIVVDQKKDYITLCSLNPYKETLSWNKAKEWCKTQFDGRGRLPKRQELLKLIEYPDVISKILNYSPSSIFWTNDEYGQYYAWRLNLRKYGRFGYVYDNHKCYLYSVLAFFDVPIIEII